MHARNTERASSIFRAPRIPRTMKRSSSVRGSRLHASTICSSEQIHLRGISRFIAVVSRQAAISRAAESCLRESWFTRRRRRQRSLGSSMYFSGLDSSAKSLSSQWRRPSLSSSAVMERYILGRYTTSSSAYSICESASGRRLQSVNESAFFSFTPHSLITSAP